jgi:hypothetical protein
MPDFGETAREYADRSQGGDDFGGDDIWIKGFRDGATRVRFLLEPDDMVHYREHFHKQGVGYFPCARKKDTEPKSNCVGCIHPDAEVNKRQHRYASNAIDEKGYQQIYKLGSRLHGIMQGRFQRTLPVNTICDRDYTIVRSGKDFNEITYFPEPGDVYPMTLDEPMYEIKPLLAAKYAAEIEALALPDPEPVEEFATVTGTAENEWGGPQDDPYAIQSQPAVPAPVAGRIQPRRRGEGPALTGPQQPVQTPAAPVGAVAGMRRSAPRPLQPHTDPDPAAVAVAAPLTDVTVAYTHALDEAQNQVDDQAPIQMPVPAYAGAGGDITQADFAHIEIDKLGSDDLRTFLADESVEFPERAPRTRLAKIAQAYIKSYPEF